ncbi:hypothetical protein LZC95_49460 [Pendulispora brunnea]|uniref:Uncharacterized protein n=1 Tax=Pendulispora brunnea TaxID=2905690 RepID=A0ABZ2KC48_9BACT
MGILITVPTPKPKNLWFSMGPTTLTPAGDMESGSVFCQREGMVKLGSDVRYFRMHLSTPWLPGPPAVVTPIFDLGLCIPVIALGGTKTIWGPYSIKANITAKGDNPAVMLIEGSLFGVNIAPLNSMVCSDPCDLPAFLSMQSANSVRAGMTLGDVIGNVVTTLTDVALSKALNLALGKLLGKNLPSKVLNALEDAGLQKLHALSARLSNTVTRWLGDKVINRVTREYLDNGSTSTPLGALLNDTLVKGMGDMVKDGNFLPFANFFPQGDASKLINDRGVMKGAEEFGEWLGGQIDK